MSLVAPGVKPMTMRIGREGQAWLRAAPGAMARAAAAEAPSRMRRREATTDMGILLFLYPAIRLRKEEY
jgi:hypothetical protein